MYTPYGPQALAFIVILLFSTRSLPRRRRGLECANNDVFLRVWSGLVAVAVAQSLEKKGLWNQYRRATTSAMPTYRHDNGVVFSVPKTINTIFHSPTVSERNSFISLLLRWTFFFRSVRFIIYYKEKQRVRWTSPHFFFFNNYYTMRRPGKTSSVLRVYRRITQFQNKTWIHSNFHRNNMKDDDWSDCLKWCEKKIQIFMIYQVNCDTRETYEKLKTVKFYSHPSWTNDITNTLRLFAN